MLTAALGCRRRVSEKEAIGHQSMDMRMEVKVFAEGVEGEDDAGHAPGAAQGRAEIFAKALVGQSAEPLEEPAMALEVRPQHPRDGQHSRHLRERRDGGLELRLETSGRKEVTRWILSWMPHVSVLAPLELRKRVRDRMRQGLARCR